MKRTRNRFPRTVVLNSRIECTVFPKGTGNLPTVGNRDANWFPRVDPNGDRDQQRMMAVPVNRPLTDAEARRVLDALAGEGTDA